MSEDRDDDERPCLHCMMIELIDDYFAEYPATIGEPDTIDNDEVVTAIPKTVAELTCGQDGTIRQQLIKQLMQSFVETPEHVQSVPTHGTRATGRFALRARLSFGRGVWTPIRAL